MPRNDKPRDFVCGEYVCSWRPRWDFNDRWEREWHIEFVDVRKSGRTICRRMKIYKNGYMELCEGDANKVTGDDVKVFRSDFSDVAHKALLNYPTR